jgi:chemotaxis protein MotB
MLIWLPLSAVAEEGAVAELIYFLEDSGRNALVYTTVRSEYSGYELRLPAAASDTSKQERFFYIYPEKHEWVRTDEAGYELLKLPKGDFATLRRVDLNDGRTLQVDESGTYSFTTPTTTAGGPGSHQGIWNSPDGFRQITYTWVFPEVFEPVSYESSQPGEWVRRYNTITYYGKDVNDLTFKIVYRSRLNELYAQMKKMFGDEEKVDVSEGADGVRVSIEATLLYPSGVADLSAKGREVLGRAAKTLRKHPAVRVIVEGHTDTDRIGKTLAKRYPTNWELSAARSINVIRYLSGLGIAESRLEGRAFSSTRPVDDNDSAEGKAKNRRIELLLAHE